MTNPDNIVRVRARNGGRASVYEANGWAQAYTSGLLEGNGVTQNTSADMNVLVGGSATKPDVVLAINPADYKIGLDLIGQQAIAITAPASNSRISAIVAYTDDLSLATTEDTVTGSPSSCGLIVVNGTASASPSEPTDNQIRTAITADGATGSQASYCVIATVLVESTTTTITDSMITIKRAQIGSQNIDLTTYAGEHFIMKHTGGNTFTLPAGYTTYHIRGSISYGTCTEVSGLRIHTSNYSGTSWARRILESDEPTIEGRQFSYSNGGVIVLGPGTAIGTNGGGVTIDMMVTRHDVHLYFIATFHHTGANASGLSTGEAVASDISGDIPIEIRNNNGVRTFSNADFVISAIR